MTCLIVPSLPAASIAWKTSRTAQQSCAYSMSWSWASASTPSARTSFERGLSSEPKSSVSAESKSFRRNPSPSVTLKGFASALDRLMSSLIFRSFDPPRAHRCTAGTGHVPGPGRVVEGRSRDASTSLDRKASRLHVTSVVPQSNHRLGTVVLIAEGTQARRAQQEESARSRLETEPAGGEHAQEVAARKEQHVSLDGADTAHHALRPDADLVRRFPTGTAVAEELPVRTLRKDLGAATPLVFAVVPLEQVGIDRRHGGEAGELAGPKRALQGTGKHPGERQPLQPFPEPARVALAALGQRDIREPGVLPGEGPGRFTMPRQVRDGEHRAHTIPRITEHAPVRPRGTRAGGTSAIAAGSLSCAVANAEEVHAKDEHRRPVGQENERGQQHGV